MGNGTQSPTAISGGDGYDQLTINAHYPYWSVISGFEEISADGTGVIPDHIGQAGTTLKFSYVNTANLDFSAETDANIEINTNTRTREAAEDTNDDTLIGGALDDIINSLAGNDTVTGGAGDDTINTGSGDDTVTGGAGDDTIDGGLGTDIAIFSGNQSDYTVTEVSYTQYTVVDNRGTDGTDTLTKIETLRFADQDVDITPSGQELTGTSSNDSLTGDLGDDYLSGLAGDDTLKGLEGNDEIHGGDGNDIITGGRGDDTLNGDGDDDTITGGEGIDTIRGGTGDDTLSDFGISTIYGGAGNDTFNRDDADTDETEGTYGLVLYGEEGNDTFNYLQNIKTLDAGSGDDVVAILGNGTQSVSYTHLRAHET